jgi:hypothetical protein
VDFASLSETGGEGERLTDIRFLEIGKISQEIFDRSSRGDGLDDHPHRDAHASDAWLAAHQFWIDRDSPELLHVMIIAQLLLQGATVPS